MDEEGQTLLLNLKAEAGHIYYIRYHAMFLKDSPAIAFFEKVDEDEGLLLFQRTEEATSTLKKYRDNFETDGTYSCNSARA
jgi:hypothetical protein